MKQCSIPGSRLDCVKPVCQTPCCSPRSDGDIVCPYARSRWLERFRRQHMKGIRTGPLKQLDGLWLTSVEGKDPWGTGRRFYSGERDNHAAGCSDSPSENGTIPAREYANPDTPMSTEAGPVACVGGEYVYTG